MLFKRKIKHPKGCYKLFYMSIIIRSEPVQDLIIIPDRSVKNDNEILQEDRICPSGQNLFPAGSRVVSAGGGGRWVCGVGPGL